MMNEYKYVKGLIFASEQLLKHGKDNSVNDLLEQAEGRSETAAGLLPLYEFSKRGHADIAMRCVEKVAAIPEISKDKSLLAWSQGIHTGLVNRDIMDPDEHFEQLIAERGFWDTRQILYADIDLNMVDGSAVWMSSMASILAQNNKTIILSKSRLHRDVIIKNISSRENVLILTPGNVSTKLQALDMPACIRLIRTLDQCLPMLESVFIRGLAAANELLSDRQFHKRSHIYLTDLYEHRENKITIKDLARRSVDTLARQSAAFLVQTPQLESLTRSLTPYPFKAIMVPPPIPNALFAMPGPGPRKPGVIRIGYAGKIAPNWGIQHLIEWVGILQEEGANIEVTIIGDKISGAATEKENQIFHQRITEGLKKISATRLGALDRARTQQEMQKTDFAWCWRPAEFEQHTLELSTKLIEGVASNLPCIAYPNAINRESLGEKYPFFARTLQDFRRVLGKDPQDISKGLRSAISKRHSFDTLAARLASPRKSRPAAFEGTICFAAHDRKFINPYYSDLKSRGIKAIFDPWEWGGPTDEQASRKCLERSRVIFCEWGLANAVWYSRNLQPGPKLIVRMHQQEIRAPGIRFGKEMNHARVDQFIFVSEWVRQEALKMFAIPPEKTRVIKNFILDDEYLPMPKSFSGTIILGMVGIIPKSKRLDRAVSVLKALIKAGHPARLMIKGPRPETIEFMTKGHRRAELDYYYEIYSELENDPDLKDAVEFFDWGNDVAGFYGKVDHILSPSDFEGFHYALADGVLSGCHPIAWDWEDIDTLYSRDWVVENTDAAVKKILDFRQKLSHGQIAELNANRNLVVSRYASSLIFSQLDALIL